MYVRAQRSLWVAIGALLALAGCAAESESAREPGWDPWIGGGQTGSLRPRCGLPEAAMSAGVPASQAGFVVYASECEGSFSLSELSLRDEDGRAIAFEVQGLSGGAVLITPAAMLPPGTYGLGPGAAASEDDAGFEPFDAGSAPVGDVLRVAPVAPAPERLGTFTRVGEACSPTFALALDETAAAHAALLALEFQIDGGAVQPFIAYGALELRDGVATLTLPEGVWLSLPRGTHALTFIARLAGEDEPLESISMPLEVACEPPASSAGDGSWGGLCTLTGAPRAPRARSAFTETLLIALAASLLARRRRRPH